MLALDVGQLVSIILMGGGELLDIVPYYVLWGFMIKHKNHERSRNKWSVGQ